MHFKVTELAEKQNWFLSSILILIICMVSFIYINVTFVLIND